MTKDIDVPIEDKRKENLRAGGKRLNCNGCCSTCGRHFVSDDAFDMHRQGEFEVTNEKGEVLKENTRHCVNPYYVEGLESYWGKCKGKVALLWKRHREYSSKENPSAEL